MAYLFLSFIKLSHLSALGVESNHLYLILIILGVVASYVIVQPFIEWFVLLQSTKLISYLVSSLLVVLLFFTVALLSKNISELFFPLLSLLLKVLALFGGILVIYGGIRHFTRKNLTK